MGSSWLCRYYFVDAFTFPLHTLIKRYIELLYGGWMPRNHAPFSPSSFSVIALGVVYRVDTGEGTRVFLFVPLTGKIGSLRTKMS